ncbi:FecR family protein [Leptolyngbya sp. NIES-2104]|uniref:FecR family protein n=1 Tax=Leptolyngbya sp. NIES-2104 TaxID=1552121 RepID=UPI0006EC7612|nr:FecR domain-containing protein [Leptolyngbya sp. NIES-2104]GAP94357.1 conserved domain protein [Leptolyngbya sp. NIES-2104]
MKFTALSSFLFAFCIQIPAFAQPRDLSVRVDRWLSIQQVSGTVSYDRSSISRAARVGDRLEVVGDGITTGTQSGANLLLDTGVGVLNVLEYTSLRVQRLDTAPDNGRITHLDVTRGQVRLKLRRFTSPNSELRIRTPAGFSGIRGTEFGVVVQPNGKTAIATLEGAVVTEAQGVQVEVPAGFQNFTIPGQPPRAAVPLRDDPGLTAEFAKLLDRGIRKVQLVGAVDPVNVVTVNGVQQSVDENGTFRSSVVFASSFLRVRVVVTTPLGKSQTYELALR